MPTPAVDVVCLGESMVTFLPTRPGRLADVPSFDRGIGGAESNVACALAPAGHPRVGSAGSAPTASATTWSRRSPATESTPRPSAATRSAPPASTSVPRGTARPTLTRSPTTARASAASAMSVTNVDLDALRSARIAAPVRHHRRAVRRLPRAHARADRTAAPGRPAGLLRRQLPAGTVGGAAEDARVLLDLARGADLVFVGEDEAEDAWGITRRPRAVRAALPEPAAARRQAGQRRRHRSWTRRRQAWRTVTGPPRSPAR